MRRREDPAPIQGYGEYVGDLTRTGLLHVVVNPMGVKGIGEAVTIGSAHTIVNAVVDTLVPLGVRHVDMPIRPKRVWQAMQEARV